jgi:hypothetical protein
MKKSLHPPLVKGAVSLQGPLLEGHIVISKVFPTEAILHQAKQVKA